MKRLIAIWDEHGTKILGAVQAILAGWLLIPGLFPPEQIKYAQAIGVVLGVLTVKRGYTNTARQPDDTDAQSGA